MTRRHTRRPTPLTPRRSPAIKTPTPSDDPRAEKALMAAQDIGITILNILGAHLHSRLQPPSKTAAAGGSPPAPAEAAPASQVQAPADPADEFAERGGRRIWGLLKLFSHLIVGIRIIWHEIEGLWK